eukprot:CAMPEP_0184696434 /NCGR_PEP_ID=MMETSP0313-20130426/3731_1 /TAXON_ID=2792 /ORGANISM="Porphyridium aerugineum, Strain SAG 1380-2" /LENGTH=342 /DNA_ID=CAMNT_0027155061 /DNA_START=254 /DNA_END=1282 /DNA_ORIENTATION=-
MAYTTAFVAGSVSRTVLSSSVNKASVSKLQTAKFATRMNRSSLRMTLSDLATAKVTGNGVTTISPVAPAPAAPAAPPAHQLSPTELWQKIIKMGVYKGEMSASRIFTLSFMAGLFISMAAMMSVQVGLSVPSVASGNPGLQKLLFSFFGLPFGLTLVCSIGGELFTGNTSVVPAAYLKGKVTGKQMFKSLVVSYLGNLCGALVFLMGLSASGLMTTKATATGLAAISAVAQVKTSMTWSQAFVRGIFCNWLVCMAVWLQAASNNFINKFFAILVANSTFIMIGFEHSIANMFYIPLAIIFGGADVTWGQFVNNNLIPVTLGNIVGALALVTLPFYVCHDSKN